VTTFRFIAAKRTEHSIALMCRVLEVSRSGYHAWMLRPLSPRGVEDARLTKRICELFPKRRGAYGSPRIWSDLVIDDGERISRKRVERLMRLAGLSASPTKKWRGTTIRVPGVRVADDLVDRKFAAGAPNRVWVADITYLRTWQGWLYLVAVQDLFSRRIVGWSMQDHMRAELVTDALEMARAAGIAQSMGSRGDCFDNAVAESFFATLKKELVHRRSWPTKDELRSEVFDYIEVFYNRERRHSTLGQRSPAEYEKLHLDHTHAA
jgi:putative transposase